MRIASYNVMSGGFDSYTSMSTAPERLPLLQKAVKKLDADIIGLIDTFRWDQIYSEDELSKLFNYRYSYRINLNDERLKRLGHNNGLTLLSNIKMTPSTIGLGTRDAILARIEDHELKFNLVIAYLDDLSEDSRLEQIKILHSVVDFKEPLIVMGDLNSIKGSERALVKTAFDEFATKNPEVSKKLKPAVDDMLRAEVIKKMESWGLRDADERHLPTMPTPLFPADVHIPFLRVDYCLYLPSLLVSDVNVAYGEVFQKASDHFPIVFDIE